MTNGDLLHQVLSVQEKKGYHVVLRLAKSYCCHQGARLASCNRRFGSITQKEFLFADSQKCKLGGKRAYPLEQELAWSKGTLIKKSKIAC